MLKRLREWLHGDCFKKYEKFRVEQQARYAILEGALTHSGKELAAERAQLKHVRDNQAATINQLIDLHAQELVRKNQEIEQLKKGISTPALAKPKERNLHQYAQAFDALKAKDAFDAGVSAYPRHLQENLDRANGAIKNLVEENEALRKKGKKHAPTKRRASNRA